MTREVVSTPQKEGFRPYRAKWPQLITHEQGIAVLSAPQKIEPQQRDLALSVFEYWQAESQLTAAQQEERVQKLGKYVQGIDRYTAVRFNHMNAQDDLRLAKGQLEDVARVAASLREGNVAPARDFLLGAINEAILDRRLTFNVAKKRDYSEGALGLVSLLRQITPGEELDQHLFSPLAESLEWPFIAETSLANVINKWDKLPIVAKVLIGFSPAMAVAVVKTITGI